MALFVTFALKVNRPIFLIISGMRKRGNMLPPIADMVRIRRVDIAACCWRDLERLASTMPKDATAKDVAAVMTRNPGMWENSSTPKTAAPQRNMITS